MDSLRQRLKSALSNSPQSFYARALLEDSRTEIVGDLESALILNKAIDLGVIHGPRLVEGTIEALDEGVEILASAPLPGLPSGWEWGRGVFMALEDRAALHAWQEKASASVVQLDETKLALAPAPLRPLLEEALQRGYATCALAESQPVSFASAYLHTETHFDISIDTLEPYRNRGFARMAAAGLIGSEPLKGLSPHWGALESNPASWRTGQSLGFRPAGHLWLACNHVQDSQENRLNEGAKPTAPHELI